MTEAARQSMLSLTCAMKIAQFVASWLRGRGEGPSLRSYLAFLDDGADRFPGTWTITR